MSSLTLLNRPIILLGALGLFATACAAAEQVDPGSRSTTGGDSTGTGNTSGGQGGSSSNDTTGGNGTTTGSNGTTTTGGSGGSGSTSTSTGAGGSSSGAGGAAGAGGTGSTGTGGGTVMAGATCVGDTTTQKLLIDDMELPVSTIPPSGCRAGSWYTFNDATLTGKQTPAKGAPCLPDAVTPARGTSMKAEHTTGSGFTVWGAGIGVDLNSAGGTKGLYDASAFSGVTFWAKGPGTVKFAVPTKSTDAAGKICTVCSDNFATTLTLTADWTQVTVKWADLKTNSFGMPVVAAFEQKAIYGFQWQVDQTATTFDFWIDDLSFTQ